MIDPITPNDECLEENIGKLMSCSEPRSAMPEASKSKVLSALLQGAAAVQMTERGTALDLTVMPGSIPCAGIQPEIMKNKRMNVRRCAKIAAAMVVVIGLGGVLTWLVPGDRASGIVFADVVRHFIQAATAKYTVVIELEGHKPVSISRMQDFENKSWPYDNSGPMGIQMLPRDWGSSRQASDPTSEGFKGETLYFFGRADREGIQDFFELMGRVHAQAKADLGNRDIDGRQVTGFRLEQGGTVYSIWADAATGLPLQIEITNQRLLGKGKVALKQFEFDVAVPTRQYGMGGFDSSRWKWTLSEEELIKALQRWAKRHDGRFPPYLTHQAWFFNTPEFFRNADLSIKDKQFVFSGHAQAVVKGVAFANQLPPGDNWYYLGEGMTLDPQDGQTPICWYQPEGSKTYRAICRNLSARTMEPDELLNRAIAE